MSRPSVGGALMNPVSRALEHTSVAQLVQARGKADAAPLCLPASCTLEKCLALLATHSFLSVPVTEVRTDAASGAPCCVVTGHVDVLDVVAFYAATFGSVRLRRIPSAARAPPSAGAAPSASGAAFLPRDLQLEPILEADWLHKRIGEIINFSGRNPTLLVSESDSVASVARKMTSGLYHRALVLAHGARAVRIDNSGDNAAAQQQQFGVRRSIEFHEQQCEPVDVDNVVCVLSQWDIVCFMAGVLRRANKNASSLPPPRVHRPIVDERHRRDLVAMAKASVRYLGLGTTMFEKEVVSVARQLPVLAALTVFISSRVSMLAVVDDSGRLVGSLSSADVRGLKGDDFLSLTLPVDQFLRDRSPASLDPPTILSSASLIKAIELVTQPRSHRLHHLWIVDHNMFPVGVCSLTDIMRFFTVYNVPSPDLHTSVLGRISVTVVRARNLQPPKNETLCTAYVVLRFPGRRSVKTPVVNKSNNPHFVHQTIHLEVTTEHVRKAECLRIDVLHRRKFFDKCLGTIQLSIPWISNGFFADTAKWDREETTALTSRIQSKWMPLRRDGKSNKSQFGELLLRLGYTVAP